MKEVLQGAAVGLFKCRGIHYMQIIFNETELHYFMPLNEYDATAVSMREDLMIEETDGLPAGPVFVPERTVLEQLKWVELAMQRKRLPREGIFVLDCIDPKLSYERLVFECMADRVEVTVIGGLADGRTFKTVYSNLTEDMKEAINRAIPIVDWVKDRDAHSEEPLTWDDVHRLLLVTKEKGEELLNQIPAK